jgi:hypothetical protein
MNLTPTIGAEVCAKLLALKFDYLTNGPDSEFDIDKVKLYYHICYEECKKATKDQIIVTTLEAVKFLEQIGFKRDHLLKFVTIEM